MFTCFTGAEDVSRVSWLLNGTAIQSDVNSRISFAPGPPVGLGELQLIDIGLQYNMTLVSCMVEFQSGEICNSSLSSLILQGKYSYNLLPKGRVIQLEFYFSSSFMIL